MIAWWTEHVAWRFRARQQQRRRRPGRPPHPGSTKCRRCGGPRDDQSLARCAGCRAAATEYERRRIGRLEARGTGKACVSCHRHNSDLTFKLCPECRASRTDASRRKRAEVKMAKMAPPPLTSWGANRVPTGEIFE